MGMSVFWIILDSKEHEEQYNSAFIFYYSFSYYSKSEQNTLIFLSSVVMGLH